MKVKYWARYKGDEHINFANTPIFRGDIVIISEPKNSRLAKQNLYTVHKPNLEEAKSFTDNMDMPGNHTFRINEKMFKNDYEIIPFDPKLNFNEVKAQIPVV